MMAKPVKLKKPSLLRLVEERELAKKMEEEKRKQETEEKQKQVMEFLPDLPKDCILSILIRLPIEALRSSSFVCKLWHNIINDMEFIDSHFCRSETVFLFASRMRNVGHDINDVVSAFPKSPNTVSVEDKLRPPGSSSRLPIIFDKPRVPQPPKLYIKFLKLEDGIFHEGKYDITCLGSVRASCHGLILLDNTVKKGGVVIMNPVTRKLFPLPLGTLAPQHNESFAFALSSATGKYKVVHLFMDDLRHVSCEVLSVGAGSWREIDGPSFGLIRWLGFDPVSAIGALHWVPHVDHSDYIVSMEVDGEKFHQIALPKSCRTHDRVVELNGFLAFVAHEDVNQIGVWVLKGVLGNVWTKHHNITRGCILDLVPFGCLRTKGDLFFKRYEDRSIYVYDFQLEKMAKVVIPEKHDPKSFDYFPHVNSLVSWL